MFKKKVRGSHKKTHYYFGIEKKYEDGGYFDYLIKNTNTWSNGVINVYSNKDLSDKIREIKLDDDVQSKAIGWTEWDGLNAYGHRYYVHKVILEDGTVGYSPYKKEYE